MDSIWDFIRAASPWVAMGLLLAIFFVRSAVKKKKGKILRMRESYLVSSMGGSETNEI